MTAAIAQGRQGLVSSISGILITFFLLFMLSLSHQFLTRRSESQTRISLGPVGSRSESTHIDRREADLPLLQSELQALQETRTVSEFSIRDLSVTPKPVDWTRGQKMDFSAISDMPAGSIGTLEDGIGPPMETAPNSLYMPSAEFPEKLIREGVVSGSALLHINIDTTGHCEVLKVMAITHKGLEEAIVRAVEKAIYQVPRKNGQIASREVLLPITFQANEERVRMIQTSIGTP